MNNRYDIGKLGSVATELLWLPQTDVGSSMATDDLRLLATQYSASAIVEWSARQKISVGLDLDAEEGAPTVPSLALVATEGIPSNWVGVFELQSKFWVCAANNGHPYPMGDKVFEAEQDQDAIELVLQIRDILGLSQIYAPEYLKIDGAVDFRLEELKESEPRMLLRSPEPDFFSGLFDSVKQRKKQLLSITALAVACLLAWQGWDYYNTVINADEREKENERQEQEDRRIAQLDQEAAEATFREKWEKLTYPSTHLGACKKALRALMRPIAFWESGNQKCDKVTVSVKKLRQGGNNKRLYKQVSTIGAESLQDNDDTFILSKIWERPSLRGPHVLIALQNIKYTLNNLAADAEIDVNFNKTESEGAASEGGTEVFRTTFKLAGAYYLPPITQVLDNIPGLGVVNAVRNDEGRWVINGEIYHVQ